MPRGPVAHIAEHFTNAGKKLLTVHAKSIGRYDRRGVTLQHGSVLSIRAMRARRLMVLVMPIDGKGQARFGAWNAIE